MNPRPTFDRVYRTLKGRLVAGDFAPGAHLEPAVLGEELFSSATPVRDVLHRLVGERLVEAPRNDGFRVPLPSEAELRGLYGWRLMLLDLATKTRGGAGRLIVPARDVGAAQEGAGTDELFLAITRHSGRRELEPEIANASERLGLFRQAEGELFTDLANEVEALWSSVSSDDWQTLRRGLAAFHRRRQRHVPDIIETAWRIAHNRQIGAV